MTRKNGSDLALNLIELIERFPHPEAARKYLESIRWPDGPVCPHCGVCGEATELHGEAHRPGVYKCRACGQQFTVTVKTIFEDSHIKLHKWVIAFHLLCASKKGLSSHQLHRMLGITYKSAWFMSHRIRYAMQEGTFEKLEGVVEVDETYVGGKAKNAHKRRGIPKKMPVVALVERGGRVRAKAIANITGETIREVLKSHVTSSARIMTDSALVYDGTAKSFRSHDFVNHSAGEYVRGNAHTQTVESFNALVKRGVVGAYHRLSERHLDRYLDEFSFRWNHRRASDGERMVFALRQSAGKRLTYRDMKKAEPSDNAI
jgi:transposase-like protein